MPFFLQSSHPCGFPGRHVESGQVDQRDIVRVPCGDIFLQGLTAFLAGFAPGYAQFDEFSITEQ